MNWVLECMTEILFRIYCKHFECCRSRTTVQLDAMCGLECGETKVGQVESEIKASARNGRILPALL
eukprot:6194534-Pleurochrysis_carterae.AAC.8